MEISYKKDNPNCRIVCAANLNKSNGLIICGARHFDKIMRAVITKTGAFTNDIFEQGFIDQFGNFYTRHEAWIVAERNNQIIKEVSSPGTLYSENLF